jgi:tetratricopeptide (TPR) repeat protein
MSRVKGTTAILSVTLFSFLLSELNLHAQAPKSTPAAGIGSTLTVEKALVLAEQGHCKEALPALKRAANGQGPADTRKRVGVAALRCALSLDERDSTADIARVLYKQFNDDPDILFILVHAYSDLSTRVAQDLGRKAPQSIPAHKLNAEALEMQGRWDDAQHEYEVMIQQNPNEPGFHFLLGRSLLSRPDIGAKTTERAKQEFQKEVEIDPKNPAAHYVLGELARKEENWEEAINQFSAAARLDPNFAEAYLGWGFCLLTVNRYVEAVAPLRAAARLTPGNPAVHLNLGNALSRTGQKEEAEKEFAIHRSLISNAPPTPAPEKH